MLATDRTLELVRAYYDCWKDGIRSFDEARLRSLLAPDLVFEGPIAGRRVGAEPFIKGLRGFVETLEGLRMIQQLQLGDEAAFLYDCDLTAPAGTFRFAEFLRFDQDRQRIREVRIVFDATRFRS